MGNQIRAEWYKLRKNGTFRSMCFFMIAAVIIYPLLTYFTYPKEDGHRIALTGMELYVNAVKLNQFFLQIGVGILAGFFISVEYSSGVLKRAASVGNGRGQLYLSKLGIYSLGMIIVSLLVPIVSTGIGSVMAGLDLLSGFGQPAGISVLEYVFRTFGFTALFSAAFASIAAYIAVILEDNGKTIGFSIVLFLFVDQILHALGNYVPLLKSVYNYSLFRLFKATIEYKIDNSDLFLSILMPMVTIAGFTLLGVYAFRQKEIH